MVLFSEVVQEITNELNAITIGRTSIVWDTVVTRWSQETWEAGTFGKEQNLTNLEETKNAVSRNNWRG